MALTQAGLGGGSSWPWWFKLALVVQAGLGGSSWPWWFKLALVVA